MEDIYKNNEDDEGSEVTQDPVRDEYQTEKEQARWIKEMEAAEKERKTFDQEAVKTIERYSGRKDGNASGPRLNIYFANTEIKLAQLYARTPEGVIKRRFDDADDDVSRVAADRLQRNLAYELDSGNFDQKMKQMIFDYVVPGIGIGWARLEEETTPATTEIQSDPATGIEIEVEIPEQITNQFAEIDYVAWDDFLWAPCQVWTECRWVGRRVPMSKEAVTARFSHTASEEVLKSLVYDKDDSASNASADIKRLKPKNSVEKTCDVYELWDKENRKVFWISKSAPVPLDVSDDTNEFPDFFPTPLPPLGKFNTSSTLPISDYSQVRGLYLQLDDLQAKLDGLIAAIKLVWVYDASVKELKDLYTTTGALEGVPIENWLVQMEKGGLKGAIEFGPLAEVINTYQSTLQAQQVVLGQIYKIEGISDIMLGQSQAYDNVAVTQQKAAFGTSRLDAKKREVAAYVQGLLRLKAHLMCKFYEPKFILDRAGSIVEADRQYIEPAMALLKQDPLRRWRLEVAVDSIQLPNWNTEKQERTELVQAVSMMLAQIVPAAASNPALAMLGGHLLKFSIAGFKGAEDIEGVIDQGLEQMARAGAMQQGQPAKKTDAEVKAEAEVQKATIQAQADIATTQMKTQSDQQIEQQKAQIASFEAQLKAMKLQLGMGGTA